MKIDFKDLSTSWTSADLTADRECKAINMDSIYGFSVFVKWTGVPVGSFLLQASNDNVENADQVTEWVDIAGETVAAGGADGKTIFNVDGAFYKWARVVYDFTSGTGTIEKTYFNVKGA